MTTYAPLQATGQTPVVTTPVPARERLFADAVQYRTRRQEFRMFLARPRSVTVAEIAGLTAVVALAVALASIGFTAAGLL